MRKSWIFLIMSMLLTVSVTGCAGGPAGRYGSILPDDPASKTFESFQLDRSFNYYVSGSDAHPNALLGLDKQYTLDTTFWKGIDLTPEGFRDLVLRMQARASQIGQRQFGFAVFDDQGRRIGIWYSILSARTPVVIKGDGHVEVYTPDIDTYIKYERRD